MKAITGNRLDDGAVVYLNDEDEWTTHFCASAKFADEDAENVFQAVQKRTDEIAEFFLIDVDEDGVLAGRKIIRETIRSVGPTVRPDLGREGAI
ncbi:MAG: DUF2849 domain-containing protein [Marinicaulis sp.]|nr:DUF2849 domain-containing protein [Marinicaulis sp.]